MSNPLRKENYYYKESYGAYHTYCDVPEIQQRKVKVVKKRKKASKNIFAAFFAFLFLAAYGYLVCPYNFKNYFEPLFLNRILNYNTKLDVSRFVSPTNEYARNSFFLDEYLLVPHAQKSKEIVDIQILHELTSTKAKLLELFKKYPKLEPAVFVWEYSTNSGLEINANTPYPSASIIKIPVAFELMRLVDSSAKTQNPIKLSDTRVFSEDFRTSGSGHLQLTKSNVSHSIDHLANIMITDSDNSATNMLLYEIGGRNGFNRSMRNLGLKVTSMGNWLPDLEGTNKITAREISTILYNIDNPNYINPKYKAILKEYLSNVRNTHLLKEKLPPETMIFHKTGNIGTMLGDSGIIYTNNGKKYIVTILVKRPHNDYGAKVLIQDASLLIYNDIKAMQ